MQIVLQLARRMGLLAIPRKTEKAQCLEGCAFYFLTSPFICPSRGVLLPQELGCGGGRTLKDDSCSAFFQMMGCAFGVFDELRHQRTSNHGNGCKQHANQLGRELLGIVAEGEKGP